MAEDEDFDTWKARWKKRSETARDACVACDQEWRMPCSEKDSMTMKAACSDKLWKKAAEILDLESVEYDLLPLIDAISLMETAQDKIDLATKNRKVLKRNQKQPDKPAATAAKKADPSTNGSKGRTQTPFHLLLPGSLSGDCRFFALGTCNKGVNCPYKHKGAEKAQEAAAAAEEKKRAEAAKTNASQVKEADADLVIRGKQGLPAPRPKTNCALSKVTESSQMEEDTIRVRLIGALTKGADPEEGSEESSESELERSNDSVIDAIPEDHQQWLFRVSKGRQGSKDAALNLTRSDRAGRMRVSEKYSHEGFAVEGDRVNHVLLKAHNATDILNSSAGTDISTDLETDDLSDDEHTSECEVIRIRKQMKAAGEREDYEMAGELQLKLKSLKKGLLRAAEKRGANKEDLTLMKKHQSMRQLTMQQVVEKQRQDAGEMKLPVVVISRQMQLLAYVSDDGSVTLPGLSGSRTESMEAREWEGNIVKFALKHRVIVTSAMRIGSDDRQFMVMDTDSLPDIDGMVWIELDVIPHVMLSALHKDFVVEACIALGLPTTTGNPQHFR
jgi:hypothetical protein